MIEKNHSELSIRRQCALLDVNRNRLVSRPKLTAEDQEIMRDLDELHTRWPYYGQRKLVLELRKRDWGSGSQASPAPDALDGDGRGRAQAENERA